MSRQWTFFWLTGTAEVLPGSTAANALNCSGFSRGALAALDFYAPGDKRTDYRWDQENHEWESIDQEEA